MLQMSDESFERLRRALARHHRAEAKKEGRAEARVEMVLMLLAERFGSLAEQTQSRIRQANRSKLNALAKRLLRAETLSEALGDLE